MISKEEMNYSSNTACMIGYMQGFMKSYAAELEKTDSLWSKEEIAGCMRRLVELTDKWFEVRYQGPFQIHEIEAMIQRDRSDIVELERAEKK